MSDDGAIGSLEQGELAALEPGQMLAREFGGQKVLLCNVAGSLYALENRCSHAAVELSQGSLDGYEVECPFHGARFDVRSGAVLCQPARRPIATYDVVPTASGVEIRPR